MQHALRAFTPKDRKALKAAAETFRENPAFKTDKAILEVGVGEALVSTLEKKGVPSMVERTLIRPPSSRLGPCDALVRAQAIANSPVAGLYDTEADRESAYELLQEKIAKANEEEAKEKARQEREAATSGRQSRSTSSRRRSTRRSPLENVLTSPTVIRSVLGILNKMIKN